MAQYHASVKTQSFSCTVKDTYPIKNISVATSCGPTTIRIFSDNSRIRQQILKLLHSENIQALLEDTNNCLAISDSSSTLISIQKTISLLKANNYVAQKLSDEICQNLPNECSDVDNPNRLVKGIFGNNLEKINNNLNLIFSQKKKTVHSSLTIQPMSTQQKINNTSIGITKNISNIPTISMVKLMEERIKKIIPIKLRYSYEGEESINPAYTDIENSTPLCPNEKRIFVLRSDLILATGIKNVCVNEGNTDLFQKIDPRLHQYLNRKDRYGHPSLAKPENHYDGSVYYAGWLCQRENHIKVFLQSGRFHNSNLTITEKMDIELYISYKFMEIYGKQNIIFYDCGEDEKLTLFLNDCLPKEKPHRVYTPKILASTFSDENHKRLISYEERMKQVKINLSLSLKKLVNDNNFINDVSSDCLKRISNLSLTDNTQEKNISFDSIWKDIKNIFDQIMYHQYNKELITINSYNFKKILKIFIDNGLPFVEGRKLTIWSTRFARDEAVRFSKENNAVTDGMAQKYLRNILLGWPDGKLNVFYDLVKTPEPLFPPMATIFWNAMSNLYIDEMNMGDEIHFFFQNSITVGNFCWKIELDAIRNKNGKIILHQYDTTMQIWKPPVDMDSSASDSIFLQRRSLHLFDKQNPYLNPLHVKIEGDEKIWKQEFKNDDLTQELVNWYSPKTVTLGKIKSIIKGWKSLIFQFGNDKINETQNTAISEKTLLPRNILN